MIYVGIDVAKDKHDCCILGSEADKLYPVFTIPNNKAGFDELYGKIFSVTDDKAEIKVGLQKREGSRFECYQDELPALHPLPSVPYEIATWFYGRAVNLDYHVVFECNRYSCPYQYARKKVDLRVTDTTVEIFYGSNRLTTHDRFRSGRKNQYSTHPEDMPDKFKFSPWNEERIQSWADSIGEYTSKTISRIFSGVNIKEQGFNPALAVLRLSNKYSSERLEAACEYAITHGMGKPRYHHLNSILSTNQDITYLESKVGKNKATGSMGYLRGSNYYGGGSRD
ncbi:MAG: IS110 family transposase [Lachnospiraceae bacterium]|nr:IS110 family transposase [Lachnospiraceae bacterium]